MKAMLAAALLAAIPANAFAIQRYTSTNMSCARAQGAIAKDGAALMRYASKRVPGLQLYGRYVTDARYCNQGEYAKSVSIPTADDATCPVRECKMVEHDRSRRIFMD